MRRILILTAIVLILAALCSPATNGSGRVLARPLVAPGFGELAYIWQGHLFVLDDAGRRQITFHGQVTGPIWSHDGRSLSYTLAVSPATGQYQEWTVRADGTGAHRISLSTCFICRSPDGHRTVVPEQGFVRPPHGNGPSRLRRPAISIASTATGRIIRRYALPAQRGDVVIFRGWWPDGRAFLFQIDPGASNSIAADGLPLYSLTLADGTIHPLVPTLDYQDWGAIRGNRMLIVAGEGRSAYFNKRLERCDETGGCRTIAGGPRTIAVDPAWSPTGTEIGWVQAPAHPGAYGTGNDQTYRRWDAERTLWTASPNGTNAAPVHSVGGGIADPQWSHDGRGLLYVKDNAIWYDIHLGAGNPQIIARLFPSGQLPRFGGYWDDLAYYGHVNWESLFAWWQP